MLRRGYRTHVFLGRSLPVVELVGGARRLWQVEGIDDRFRQLLLFQVVRPAAGIALRVPFEIRLKQ